MAVVIQLRNLLTQFVFKFFNLFILWIILYFPNFFISFMCRLVLFNIYSFFQNLVLVVSNFALSFFSSTFFCFRSSLHRKINTVQKMRKKSSRIIVAPCKFWIYFMKHHFLSGVWNTIFFLCFSSIKYFVFFFALQIRKVWQKSFICI